MSDLLTKPRHLSAIAFDIAGHWPNVYFGARPYLEAMRDLDGINDRYHEDSARSIVAYFLSNATGWRGPDARRIKRELNDLLKAK